VGRQGDTVDVTTRQLYLLSHQYIQHLDCEFQREMFVRVRLYTPLGFAGYSERGETSIWQLEGANLRSIRHGREFDSSGNAESVQENSALCLSVSQSFVSVRKPTSQ